MRIGDSRANGTKIYAKNNLLINFNYRGARANRAKNHVKELTV